MAFFVDIIKLFEGENFAFYEYGLPGKKYGKIKISKANEDVILIELAELDAGAQAKRAGWKLMSYWKKGEYPNKAFWVS